MTHGRSKRARSLGLLFTIALQSIVLPCCVGGSDAVPSEWPPDDFRLVVEELHDEQHGTLAIPVVKRRFDVDARGVCVYAIATDTLWIEGKAAPLPVFGTMCVYRLVEPSTRLLARKLDKRGVMHLADAEGDQRETQGMSLRLTCRLFGQQREIRASGQVHGEFARVLHLVNAHLPSGEAFLLPGMAGDAEPSPLRGVPAPKEDMVGALRMHQQLLGAREEPQLLLQAFTLAVAIGERDVAEDLLRQWSDATGVDEASPLADDVLTADLLRTLLPPAPAAGNDTGRR